MLERLDRGNLFVIALDDERRWYRYHHLFRDFCAAASGAKDPIARASYTYGPPAGTRKTGTSPRR
jgi:LuxR family maltose regulon positive regulatory protein